MKLKWLWLLLLLALPAHAKAPDRIMEFPDAVLVFQDKPCEIGLLLASVDPKYRARLKGGLVLPKSGGSIPHRLCYVEDKTPDGTPVLVVVDEYDNSGVIAAEDVVPVEPQTLPKHKAL